MATNDIKRTPPRWITELKAKMDECRRLWDLACEFDHIDPKDQFVIFSDNNPFTIAHGKAIQEYMSALSGGSKST